MRGRLALSILLCLGLAACGGKRGETEHRMFRWAEALNIHLAGSFSEGNEYPHRLAEIDPMLRLGLPFEDAWGNAFHYRRINDGKYQLVSIGPDGEIGTEDDVCLTNAVLQKPETFYNGKPPDKRLQPQRDEAVG